MEHPDHGFLTQTGAAGFRVVVGQVRRLQARRSISGEQLTPTLVWMPLPQEAVHDDQGPLEHGAAAFFRRDTGGDWVGAIFGVGQLGDHVRQLETREGAVGQKQLKITLLKM